MPLSEGQVNAINDLILGADRTASYPESVEGCIQRLQRLRDRLLTFISDQDGDPFHTLVPDTEATQVMNQTKSESLAAANQLVSLLS